MLFEFTCPPRIVEIKLVSDLGWKHSDNILSIGCAISGNLYTMNRSIFFNMT